MRHIVLDWGKERDPWMALCGTVIPDEDRDNIAGAEQPTQCYVCADLHDLLVEFWRAVRNEATRF